jgi:hypothetical protein
MPRPGAVAVLNRDRMHSTTTDRGIPAVGLAEETRTKAGYHLRGVRRIWPGGYGAGRDRRPFEGLSFNRLINDDACIVTGAANGAGGRERLTGCRGDARAGATRPGGPGASAARSQRHAFDDVQRA